MQYHTEMLCESVIKKQKITAAKQYFSNTKLKFYKRRTTTIFGISGTMKGYREIPKILKPLHVQDRPNISPPKR